MNKDHEKVVDKLIIDINENLTEVENMAFLVHKIVLIQVKENCGKQRL